MEEAAQADRRHLSGCPKQPIPLPEPLSIKLRELLSAAAMLETDYQSTQEIDHPQSGQSDLQQLGVAHQRWMRESDAFATRLRRRDVSDDTIAFLSQTLASLGEYLAQVAKRSDRNAGLVRPDA